MIVYFASPLASATNDAALRSRFWTTKIALTWAFSAELTGLQPAT